MTRPTSAIIRIRLEIKIKLSPNDDLSDAKKAKNLTSNFDFLDYTIQSDSIHSHVDGKKEYLLSLMFVNASRSRKSNARFGLFLKNLISRILRRASELL